MENSIRMIAYCALNGTATACGVFAEILDIDQETLMATYIEVEAKFKEWAQREIDKANETGAGIYLLNIAYTDFASRYAAHGGGLLNLPNLAEPGETVLIPQVITRPFHHVGRDIQHDIDMWARFLERERPDLYVKMMEGLPDTTALEVRAYILKFIDDHGIEVK